MTETRGGKHVGRSSRASPHYSFMLGTLGTLVVAMVIFGVDLSTPLGIAGGVPYVAVVLLATRQSGARPTWIAAIGCSVLTAAGFILSPPGAGIVPTLSNRALALFAIWTTALLSLSRRSAEQRFEEALLGAPYAVLMVDAEGRIELTNPKVEEIFGYTEAELLGQTVDRLVPARARGEHERLRRSFHSAPAVRPMGAGRDLRALKKDGQEIPVEIALTPVKANQKRYVLTTIVDISQRKREEEGVAARNKELETLIHVTSHDLKEPLRAIESFSTIVHDRYREKLDPKGQDFLRRVVDAAARLRRLLDDVVRITRVRRPGERSEVLGDKPVQSALERLSARIEESGADVTVATSLPLLQVDETLATEAVYNLVSNALKFTAQGERPLIEIDAYVPSPAEGRVLGLVVRDRGIGVPPEQAERIFELFQRGVGRDVEGTGAGLAIVRAIAEQHDGNAWVQERPGGGSEFFVTFGFHE